MAAAAAITSSGVSGSCPFYAIYIVSKHGQLVFDQWLSDEPAPAVRSDDTIRIASLLHTIYAMASQVAPTSAGGLRFVKTAGVSTFVWPSPTGMKFVVTMAPEKADAMAGAATRFLSDVYIAFADYVIKNPFQNPDQPVRVDKFATAVTDASRR